MLELLALLPQGFNKHFVMFHKLEVSEIHSEMDCRRISVVGRLRAIHDIIRRTILVFTSLMS